MFILFNRIETLINEGLATQTKRIVKVSMSKTYKIAVLKGDGIGPEITEATLKVLEAVQEKADFKPDLIYGEAGYYCIKKFGTNLPKETLDMIKQTDACLKGPMTTPEEAGAPP